MPTQLKDRRIAVLATDGFEQSELIEPRDRLREAGAKVDVVSPGPGKIRGWKGSDWGDEVEVDVDLADAVAADYDALVLPGGVINPDKLRVDETAVGFVRSFFEQHKPVAAICHGPWTLVEADVLEGRQVTSYASIRRDLENAGADWSDREVVVDDGLITSRTPEDLPAFIDKIVEVVAASRATAHKAA